MLYLTTLTCPVNSRTFVKIKKGTLNMSEPTWLHVVLTCQRKCVQKYEDDNKPVESFRFNDAVATSSSSFIPAIHYNTIKQFKYYKQT